MSSLSSPGSNNEHIWQNNDLDPTLVSIYCISRKSIANPTLFTSFLKETEKQTMCTINAHGIENMADLIWLKIKSSSVEARQCAFNLINTITKNSCKEIVLPNPSSINKMNGTKSNNNKQDSDENDDDYNQNRINNRRLMPRSSTDNSINTNKPSTINPNESTSNKKRYTVEFLLSRSDKPLSQKQPANWKQLNEMYSSVCFCGKVISFFNPNKYFQHWEKVKVQNHELHSLNNISFTSLNLNESNKAFRRSITTNNINPSKSTIKSSTSSSSSCSSSNTDDFINIKSLEYHNNNKSNNNHKRFDINNNLNINKANLIYHNKATDSNNLNYLSYNQNSKASGGAVSGGGGVGKQHNDVDVQHRQKLRRNHTFKL